MNEDNPPRKKRLGFLKRSRSGPHLAGERGRNPASDPSSLPQLRNESPRESSGLVPKFLGKVAKTLARSARQSPNPEPTVASSSARDLLHPQPSQDLLPLAATTPEPNPDQSSDLRIAKSEQPDPKLVKETLAKVQADFEGIRHVPGMVENTASASNNLQSVPDTIDTFSTILGPLEVFNSIANRLADVHPYAKVALSIFTCASKMILDQAKRDDAVDVLLSKISQVYTFITQDEALAKIQSMLVIYGKIAQQTLDCADFIAHYSETKSVWKRLGKHVGNETDATIQSYNEALDGLMQQFRDQATRDAVIILHRAGEDLDFNGMVYADGAGFNTSKRCLPGTREDVLSEIKSWICSTEGNVPRVLWLSGTAGKGKSAIAHTIANWSNEQGGLGACFCFNRTREADRRHEKIFTTIARDMADSNPIMRRALAHVVHDRNELRHTTDIARQWRELIVGPTIMTPKDIAPPVLIVIEALDESGEANSREQILHLLAGKLKTSTSQLAELPANFRILVTSRPLEDIGNAFYTPSHVRHISLDDISSASTERDIQLYISARLEDLLDVFNDMHFKTLAQKSDGLFEWARLTCEYIKGTNKVGLDPTERFDAVVAGISVKGTRLLDDMYRRILDESMPEDEREETIHVFRSVMGQILASLEPLPMPALTAMRLHFPDGRSRYNLERVIRPLGSLLSGTTDSQTSIRPLHASFYDFLTDKSRSHDFFVDTSSVQSDLAFATLRVMEGGLCFNICSLESSYLPNSVVPDFADRVKKSISAALSYSCRFWGTHVAAISFEPSLAKEVEAFFDGERLLWWLEALTLMKSLGGSVATLSSIADWVSGHAEFMDVGDTTRDTLRFVRTFASTILRSTPHLYLSALPFAPTQSRIFRKFAAKFPCTPRIVAGRVVNWPQMEKILHANNWVYSVAMSPDGKRVACGLVDGTIQVWDTETGEALGAPLQGHTNSIASVAFSPDGHRIVSGSFDQTIRVWDVKAGVALGSPLQGHTSPVRSVAISPDGKRIVSGSQDNTIRAWDMETGKAFGAPLQGHTGSVLSVTISSDGHRIVSGSSDQTIRVWDVKSGVVLGSPLQGHTDWVWSVAISLDGSHIVSGSSDKTIRVWDADTMTSKASVAALQSHTASVNSVAISLDGRHIVSGSDDQTVRVWDMATGKTLCAPLQGHTDSIRSVAISPDGKGIVSGSDDKTIQMWDMGTGKALAAPLQGHTYIVCSTAISPDGHHIVSGSWDNTIRMWRTENGEPLGRPLEGHSGWVWSVAISPDGNHIVSGSNDGTVRVWDMGTGKASRDPLRGHTHYVLSVAISPDGRRIVSGSLDKTIQVWELGTGKLLGAALQGHTASVNTVAISSDGNRIVSGSDDQTVRVWDMQTGEAVGAPFRGHTGSIQSVTISPDGKHIVSGSQDRTIRVWDIEFFNQHPFTAPTICFSPNPTHALHSTTSFLQNSSTPVSVTVNEDGWVVDPEGRLLLCIPLHFHPLMYFPGNTLVIPNHASQFDLSCFAHGTSWHKCREQEAAPSS